MRTPSFALTLSLVTLLRAGAAAAEPTAASVWKTDFGVAQVEAKKLNRPIVVHFHASYCGPCRKMEREVLDAPQVLKIIDAGFVGVKVDVTSNPNVQVKYGINTLPTDMILNPDGKVLVKTEGYDDQSRAGDRDYRRYVANLTRIDSQYAAGGRRLPRTAVATDDKNKPSATANKNVPVKGAPAVAAKSPASADKLVPPAEFSTPPQTSPPAKTQKNPEVAVVSEPTAPAAAGFPLAMEGYCPVTLRMTRSWISGSSDFSLEHDGQKFQFAAAEKRDEFKANPQKFAPRLMGCDPVALAISDLAVRGSVKFGAFYEGELFLFETADSRATFRKDPARYARLQHALKPEDVKRIASAAGQ